ncbi:MAG: TolB family protein [Gemmatimonadales bacterium]
MSTFKLLAAIVCVSLPAHAVAQPQPRRNGSLPDVAPDSKRIVFVSDRDGNNQLYVINVDGTGEKRITDSKDDDKFPPRWLADNARVVFGARRNADSTSAVTVVPAGGGTPRVLGVVKGLSPVVSPDARRVVYNAGSYTAAEMTLANVDGSSPRVFYKGPVGMFNCVYARDASHFACTRSDPATREVSVWVFDADGENGRQVTHFPVEDGRAQWPSWSPDGRRLAVQAGIYDRAHPEKNTSHIWIVEVATGAATKLAAHDRPYLDETPSWFPDGSRIAFQSDRTGRMEVWVMGVDGTGARQVTR